MIHPTTTPFPFHKNGNACRRDKDATPTLLLIAPGTQHGFIELHRAGDQCTSTTHVRDVCSDPEIINQFEPVDAMQIGRAYEFWRAQS